MPDSSCCISPDLQCCTTLCLGLAGLRIELAGLRKELAGLGQNWLDCGKKQAKGQTASIAFSPVVQHLTFFIRRPPEENVVQLFHLFGRPSEKKTGCIWECNPHKGCYQGCVSYNSLFITFSLQDSSWVQTNHLLEVSILSHTTNHPCLLWQLACCCLSPKPWVDHFAQQSEGSDGVGCCISTFQWNLHWIVLRCNAVDLLDYFNRIGSDRFKVQRGRLI